MKAVRSQNLATHYIICVIFCLHVFKGSSWQEDGIDMQTNDDEVVVGADGVYGGGDGDIPTVTLGLFFFI